MNPPPLPPSLPTWTEADLNAHLDQPMMAGRDMFPGAEGMTIRDVEEDILQGGRFLSFHWCVSFIVLSYTRQNKARYFKSWESPASEAWSNSLVTMFFGWWSPHGVINTILCFWRNLRGGKDVTSEIMTQLVGPARTESILKQAIKKPLGLSQKILIGFVLLIPLNLIVLIVGAILSASSTR
jgi:hypothetical protein